jgi:phospholipase/carboxylesterase
VTATGAPLIHRMRPATGDPQGALVLFHGRGTGEDDLFPLLEELDPERRLIGVTPRAPLSMPPGGAHWYVVRQVGYPDRDTFIDSLGWATAFADWLGVSTGLPPERTVLGGFSQGTVMAYSVGLGPDRPRPAGILGLSGFMPTVEGFDLDLDAAAALPIVIRHGELDPVIAVDFGRAARDLLTAAGARIDYSESPVGHGVDPRWLPELRDWLEATLSTAPGRP